MKTLTEQLRELGCSKTEIHKYLQRLNRSGVCAYDVKHVSIHGNEIRFFTCAYGDMVVAYGDWNH